MKPKILWLLIQKGLVGIAAMIASVLSCISIYNEWGITLNVFVICIVMCFVLIGLMVYSERLELKYPFDEQEKIQMKSIDSSVLRITKGFILVLSSIVIMLNRKEVYIYVPPLLYGFWGLIQLMQFIGYYHKLK